MREGTVVAARMLSSNVRELTFEMDSTASFSFKPGQWVNLYLPSGDGEPIRRAYSIASSPRSDLRFDLAVTLVENGPMSTFLHAAEIGTKMRVSEAQGVFALEPVVRPLLFVATGTGVAPFRSMLHVLAHSKPKQPVVLLFGIRTERDVLYGEEFEALAKEWPDFSFEPTLSRASDAWKGRRGHVQVHLEEAVRKLGADCDAYICGLTRMVHDVRKILREQLKIERKHVHIERYD